MRKLIFACLLLVSAQAFGQTKKIRGQVIQGIDSSALALVKIELINYKGKSNWTVVDSTRTDIKGVFYLKADVAPLGKYIIRVNENASFKINLNKPEKKGYLDLPKFFYKKE